MTYADAIQYGNMLRGIAARGAVESLVESSVCHVSAECEAKALRDIGNGIRPKDGRVLAGGKEAETAYHSIAREQLAELRRQIETRFRTQASDSSHKGTQSFVAPRLETGFMHPFHGEDAGFSACDNYFSEQMLARWYERTCGLRCIDNTWRSVKLRFSDGSNDSLEGAFGYDGVEGGNSDATVSAIEDFLRSHLHCDLWKGMIYQLMRRTDDGSPARDIWKVTMNNNGIMGGKASAPEAASYKDFIAFLRKVPSPPHSVYCIEEFGHSHPDGIRDALPPRLHGDYAVETLVDDTWNTLLQVVGKKSLTELLTEEAAKRKDERRDIVRAWRNAFRENLFFGHPEIAL